MHSCDDQTHLVAPAVLLVCWHWNHAAQSSPSLWHHILRRPRGDNAVLSKQISRAGKRPLHLIVYTAAEDPQLAQFMHIFSHYSHRWEQIEIRTEETAHALQLLHATSSAPLLTSLVIRDPQQPLAVLSSGTRLLAYAPNLTNMYVRTCYMSHLAISSSLVNLTLLPCHVTPDAFAAIAASPIENLRFNGCTWGLNAGPLVPVIFHSLEQLIVSDVPWDTLSDLLQLIDAPNVHTLVLVLDLDPCTYSLDLAHALGLAPHMPSLTDLLIAVHSSAIHSVWYTPAVISACAWAFPTVTSFTTNLSVKHLSGLFPDEEQCVLDPEVGFSFDGTPPLLPNPLVGFPNLQALRSADEFVSDHVPELIRLAQSRLEAGYPLDSITTYMHSIQEEQIDELLVWVSYMQDWGQEDAVEADDVVLGVF